MERHRTRTRPGAVELPRGLPGRAHSPGIVPGLVEPGAPDDHRGTAPVPDHHAADVRSTSVLPGRDVAHVVPARRLLPDQQAELVAGVEEGRRLRVVRAADHIAVELVLEDLGVLALHPGTHGHAGVRVELVPVEPEQLQPLPVQVEAVGLEGRLAEPDPPGQHVTADAGEVQRGLDRVQLGAVRRPQADRPEPGQAQPGRAGPRRAGLHADGLRRELGLPVEQLDQQGAVDVPRWRPSPRCTRCRREGAR